MRALADGDYTQRRFVMAGGDEIASLTAAFNDAVASVATAIDHRRHAEERMRQFAADASHELRTPLTVIGGYIDVLRRGAIEEPRIARQILATMSLEKEHMRGLIDRLMRLARLDSEAPPHIEARRRRRAPAQPMRCRAPSGRSPRRSTTASTASKRSKPIEASWPRRFGTSSKTR